MQSVRDLAIWYLRNSRETDEQGQRIVAQFQTITSAGQRDGQAFMTLLTKEDYDRLSGTACDPFYRDGNLPQAIDFLTVKTG